MDFFLCVMGMVFILEGLPYFAVPNRMKAWVRMVMASSDGNLRKMGFAMMAVGLLLVYLGRR